MSSRPIRRVHHADLYVDREAHPGLITGAERTPVVGEEVYCAAGRGEISAVLGKTGDGSRLVEVRLEDPKAKPFYAAASNILVNPEGPPKSAEPSSDDEDGSAGSNTASTAFWIG